MQQHLKWVNYALLVLLICACSPSSDSGKGDAQSASGQGFSILLPVNVVLTEPNSIKPHVLGQLMKLTNFGLKKVLLITEGEQWEGVDTYLTPMFGNDIEFVQVVHNKSDAALGVPVQAYEEADSQSGQWQRFLFNWLSQSNTVIELTSQAALNAFADNIALLQSLTFLLSSNEFQSVTINKGHTYFLDNSELFEGRLLQQTENQTTFIVLNQTNKVQPMPLPFGFMAVAKVTRWQTGDKQFTTFVTSSPLTIGPQSLVVVIRR